MGKDSRLHGNIAAAISSQAPVVRDGLGRTLELGDEVVVYTPIHTYRVAKIEPVRQAGAPPNLMRLQLVGVIDLPCPREQPLEGIIRVRTAVEMGFGKAEEPPPSDPAEKATTVTLE